MQLAANVPSGPFRQGYEFLEPLPEGGVRLGLNFVSFQRDLRLLKSILGLRSWLGDANFGGPQEPEPGEPAPIELMSVTAGGYYAVPPKSETFPGAGIF